MPASTLLTIPALFAFLFFLLCAQDAHTKNNEFIFGLAVFGCGMMFMLAIIALLPVFAPGIAEVLGRALMEVL